MTEAPYDRNDKGQFKKGSSKGKSHNTNKNWTAGRLI